MKQVSTALVVLTVRARRLEGLLVRRPHNEWGLPGGPVGPDEALATAARAQLQAQTGVQGIGLEQLYTFDRPPAGASVAYVALIAAERQPLAPGPDVVEVRWWPLDDLPALGPEDLEVLRYGHRRLWARAAYAPIAFQVLPDTFTLSELQTVYEAVLGGPLDTRNFRRDVLAAGVVEPVGRVRADAPGRPARLYRSAGGDFAVVARERRIRRAIAHPPELQEA